jgi:hypothetical protein
MQSTQEQAEILGGGGFREVSDDELRHGARAFPEEHSHAIQRCFVNDLVTLASASGFLIPYHGKKRVIRPMPVARKRNEHAWPSAVEAPGLLGGLSRIQRDENNEHNTTKKNADAQRNCRFPFWLVQHLPPRRTSHHRCFYIPAADANLQHRHARRLANRQTPGSRRFIHFSDTENPLLNQSYLEPIHLYLADKITLPVLSTKMPRTSSSTVMNLS